MNARFQTTLRAIFVSVFWLSVSCAAWVIRIDETVFDFNKPFAHLVLGLRFVSFCIAIGALFGRARRTAFWASCAYAVFAMYDVFHSGPIE